MAQGGEAAPTMLARKGAGVELRVRGIERTPAWQDAASPDCSASEFRPSQGRGRAGIRGVWAVDQRP